MHAVNPYGAVHVAWRRSNRENSSAFVLPLRCTDRHCLWLGIGHVLASISLPRAPAMRVPALNQAPPRRVLRAARVRRERSGWRARCAIVNRPWTRPAPSTCAFICIRVMRGMKHDLHRCPWRVISGRGQDPGRSPRAAHGIGSQPHGRTQCRDACGGVRNRHPQPDCPASGKLRGLDST